MNRCVNNKQWRYLDDLADALDCNKHERLSTAEYEQVLLLTKEQIELRISRLPKKEGVPSASQP